jgi:hypothetical protein
MDMVMCSLHAKMRITERLLLLLFHFTTEQDQSKFKFQKLKNFFNKFPEKMKKKIKELGWSNFSLLFIKSDKEKKFLFKLPGMKGQHADLVS